MVYHFRIHKDEDGYWAECIEMHGCITTGKTKKETLKNCKEALELYLDDDDGLFPRPYNNVSGPNIVNVKVPSRLANKLNKSNMLYRSVNEQ